MCFRHGFSDARPIEANRKGAKSLRARYAAGLAFALVLSSCGGSGGGGTPTPPEFTVLFTNNNSGTVTFAQQAAAETALGNLWTKDLGQPVLTQETALCTLMKSMPVFQSAGYTSAGNTWGMYADGTLLSIYTADPDLVTQTSTQTAKKMVRPAISGEIPQTQAAYVIDALEPSRNTNSAFVAGELGKAGYMPIPLTGTLADWLSVANAGVLVNWSHGGVWPTKKLVDEYFLESADTPSLSLALTYRAEISAGTVSRCLVEVFNAAGKPSSQSRYQFSAQFLTSPTMFKNNDSVMFNWACESTKIPDFANGLEFTNNLGVYFGWDQEVATGDSNNSILFFFDRMLAENQIAPVSPTSPPPDTWQQAYAEMQKVVRPNSSDTYAQSAAPEVVGTMTVYHHATLRDPILGNGLPLSTIIPAIVSGQTGSISTQPDLEFTGTFGSAQGTATCGGNSLSVLLWTPTSVEVSLPSTAGPVVLASPDHLLSNTYNFGGNVTISPASTTIIPGNSTQFTAAPPKNQQGTLSWKWTLSGQVSAVLDDGSGHQGISFTTDSATVTLKTTNLDISNMVVTVEGFATAASKTASIGTASASVTVNSNVNPVFNWSLSGDWGAAIGTPDGNYKYSGALGDRETLTDNNGNPVDRLFFPYDITPSTGDVNSIVFIWLPVGEAPKVGQTFSYGASTKNTFEAWIDNPTSPGSPEDPILLYSVATGAAVPGTLTITQVSQQADGTNVLGFSFIFTDPSGGSYKGNGIGTWK